MTKENKADTVANGFVNFYQSPKCTKALLSASKPPTKLLLLHLLPIEQNLNHICPAHIQITCSD